MKIIGFLALCLNFNLAFADTLELKLGSYVNFESEETRDYKVIAALPIVYASSDTYTLPLEGCYKEK